MFDKNTLAQLEAGYQSTQAQQKVAQQVAGKPKGSSIKRLAAGLLPTVGGALGAVGGSFIAPVAGTIGGGAAGAALGEAIKQRLLGEKTNLKGIAGEAALGAVPGAFKLAKAGVGAVKGARVAKEVASAEGVARQVATQKAPIATLKDVSKAERGAATREDRLVNPLENTEVRVSSTKTVPPVEAAKASKQSLLSKLSTSATKSGSGIKTDSAVGGIDRADEAAQTFQRLKITGTPTQQLRKINQTMASHGKQVDDILAKNPIQLNGADVKTQVAKAVEDPLKYAELDLSTPGAQRALNAHLDKYAQATTAKDVNDYVKVINKVAVKAKAKLDRGGTLTDKEAAALAAKKAGDEVLGQYPEIAPLKKDMATLFERNSDVTKASEKTSGIPLLGIKSKTAANLKAAASSNTGKLLNAANNTASSSTGKTVKKVGGSLLSQMTTRALASPLTAEDQSNQLETSPNSTISNQMPTDTTTNPIINDISTLNSTGAVDASTGGIDYETEARKALASGDYKAFTAILQLSELADKKTASMAKPLSAEAAKTVSNAQTGIQALTDFNKLIQQNQGAFGRTNIPGVAALDKLTSGRVSGALGTSGLNAARQQVIDVIARLRTGAAISADEAARFEQFVPQPGDPPETQQQKTGYLLNQFQMVANRSGSAGTDLQQLVGA